MYPLRTEEELCDQAEMFIDVISRLSERSPQSLREIAKLAARIGGVCVEIYHLNQQDNHREDKTKSPIDNM